MGGCQTYGPFLGTVNMRGLLIIGLQTGTIILTTTHIMFLYIYAPWLASVIGSNQLLMLQSIVVSIEIWLRKALKYIA